jgi:hypothetical protein
MCSDMGYGDEVARHISQRRRLCPYKGCQLIDNFCQEPQFDIFLAFFAHLPICYIIK